MKKIIVMLGIILLLSACGNKEEVPDKEIHQSSPDVYAKFQNIDIKVDSNQALVVGEGNASGNKFFYKVEQGEKTLQEEEIVQVNGEWGEFEIRVDITDEMEEGEEVVIITMYTKREDGSVVNPNYVPIDLEVNNEVQE